MNAFALFGLIIGSTTLFLAILILRFGNLRNLVHTTLLMLNLALVIWGFGCMMAGFSDDPSAAMFWWKIAHIGGVYTVCFLLQNVLTVTGVKRTVFLVFAYAQATLFQILSFSNLLDVKMRYVFNSYYHLAPNGFWYPIFTLCFITVGVYATIILFNSYRHSRGNKRLLLKYHLVAFAFGMAGGIAHFFTVYFPNVFPYGALLIPGFPILTTYAILRHRLMDIEVIIKKTLVFAGLSLSVVGIFVMATFLIQDVLGNIVGIQKIWTYIISAVIISALLDPIKNFLTNLTDRYLFQKKYDPQQFIRSFIDYAATALDLDKLVTNSEELLEKAFHPKFSTILLSNNGKYVSHGTKDKSNIITIDDSSPIVGYLKSTKAILSIENENDKKISEEIKNEMINLKAVLAVPLILRDEHIGIILLGKKKSDEYYTANDLAMLMDLARAEAIAIKNAQLTKQISEKSEEKGIEDASLGASHQMKNALAIIKPPLETIYALISYTDLKTITPEKSKSLLNSSKERIAKVLKDIEKAKKIINAILYGNQKEDDAPEEINVHSLIQHAIERSSQAKSQDLVSRNIPIPALINTVAQNFPTIIAGGVLIGEALVNIINNSFDAIIERYVHIKPDSSYKSMIKVSAEDIGNYIKINIKDNGMGMTEEAKKKAFKGLFSTKKASARGRGAALFFLKKWLKARGGNVGFTSEYGKGTTFTIELPKKQEDSDGSQNNDSRR